MKILLSFALLIVYCVFADSSEASVVYSFSDGGLFDGDSVSDTATLPSDGVSGVTGTITTLAVSGGSSLNENSNSLGVQGGGTNDEFDPGEFWTFSWDLDSRLDSIGFDLLSGTGDTFSVSSDAWIGRSYMISDSALSFSSVTGTFTFSSISSGVDEFDLATLVTGDSLSVAANQSYTIIDNGGNADHIEYFQFSLSSATAVPEPACVFFICSVGVTMLGYRRKLSKFAICS